VDYDNDGWADITQINGHVYPQIDGHSSAKPTKIRALVYHNMGPGTDGAVQFKDVSAELGPASRKNSPAAALPSAITTMTATSTRNSQPGRLPLFSATTAATPKTDQAKIIGTTCNRTAIGARVRVITGTHTQMDEVHSGSSVMSQSDLASTSASANPPSSISSK